MIVRINDVPLEMYPKLSESDQVIVVKKGINPKLKKIAITLWTISGIMMVKTRTYAAGELWTELKPLLYFFQDFAMFFGTLAIIAGLILLGVKKRWGTKTLKITGFIVAGVFLAPSIILLCAILGIVLDDALTNVLQNIRDESEIIPAGGE
jgi:hypothetical protein